MGNRNGDTMQEVCIPPMNTLCIEQQEWNKMKSQTTENNKWTVFNLVLGCFAENSFAKDSFADKQFRRKTASPKNSFAERHFRRKTVFRDSLNHWAYFWELFNSIIYGTYTIFKIIFRKICQFIKEIFD